MNKQYYVVFKKASPHINTEFTENELLNLQNTQWSVYLGRKSIGQLQRFVKSGQKYHETKHLIVIWLYQHKNNK